MHIAVVGIGCRYPGANSAAELFENILSGRRYFREIPPERWSLQDYYHPDRNHPDTTYCKQAAFIEGFDFNPAAFKIPQSTFRATDLAQWMALTVAKEALDDADLSELPLNETAVILGNTLAGETSRANLVRFRWPYARRVFDELLSELKLAPDLHAAVLQRVEARYKSAFPPVNEDNLAGGLANTIAGRVCNYFNFRGGGYTVDGACSSSLLSIQEACVGLEQRLCNLALAGGVDISLDPFELVGFAKVGALSDNDIRVYDKRASGFLPGEGCGIVVLKRLEDAIADRNRIYAVIRGVGYSSDGKGGITAPSVPGQSLAVDRAYHVAGYSFADVELIEGHGTGTPVGDRTELTTFIDAKQRHGARDDHRCGIGSIKSIIGHTKAAAGVAGFIKAVMSVYHQVLPPTMGLTQPNELFGSTSHVYPLIEGRRWGGARPLRAAVSSAGFGGINTHITLESYDGVARRAAPITDPVYLMQSYQPSEAFLIGADDEAGMLEKLAERAAVAKRLSHAELVDFAVYCANDGATKRVRVGVVADTPYALQQKLERAHAELRSRVDAGAEIAFVDHAAAIYLLKARRTPRMAFLFPGQGSQYVGMGRRWHQRYAVVARHWDECDRALTGKLSQRLSDYIWRDGFWAHRERWNEWSSALQDTRIAQPAIVAASMATAELLRYLGIEPDINIGHSLGEYTALWAGGALDKSTALQLVCQRGAAMAGSSEVAGTMLSVAAAPEVVETLLADVVGYAVVSNFNAPNQTVVSGERDAVQALAKRCKERAIGCTELDVSSAFHSRLMDPARREMASVLAEAQFERLRGCVISSVHGGFVEPESALRDLLSEQITGPVRYVEAVHTAIAEGVDVFIEVGPGTVLSGLTRRILGDTPSAVFATDGGPQDDAGHWNRLVAYLYACGLPLVASRLYENRFFRAFRWPYAPKFIASPCEQAVSPLRLELDMSAPIGSIAVSARSQTAENSPVPIVSADEWTRERIFAFLQQFISNRFGYPADMVRPDTRLLDDLNLDSIKSAEVVAESMGAVGITADPNQFTKMTLGEIAERLYALRTDGVGAARDTSVAKSRATLEPMPSWVRQFALEWVEQALPETSGAWTGEPVLVVAQERTPLVDAVSEAFKRNGATVTVHIGRDPVDDIDSCSGCIAFAPAPMPTGLRDTAEAELEPRLCQFPQWLLQTAQVYLRRRNKQEQASGFFAMVTSGALGPTDGPNFDTRAGAGFVKSLRLENPDLRVRAIDISSDLAVAEAAARVLAEIRHGGGYQEAIHVTPTRRLVPQARPVSLHGMPKQSPHWSASDVLLVTGGAKGITAECLLELGRRAPARLALVGSSSARGGSTSGDITATLDRFRQNGIDARYFQCDIVNALEVAALVPRVHAEMGPIRGLIHAAGINTPHRIDDVSWDEFRRVLAPKMLGLANLLRALPLAKLKTVTAFSSIIAKSGMPGNSDYAYANEWVNGVLHWLQGQYSSMVCRSFNYSVWADIGMGVRLGSLDGLRRMGIDAIPAAEGARRFVDLMQRRWPDTELIVSSRLGSLDTIDFGRREVGGARFLEKIVQHQPGVELVSEVFLRPDIDRYIAQHSYDGSLLFPAVMGMEAMTQVAMASLHLESDDDAPGRVRLENLEFPRPIVVPADGRVIRIYAQAEERHADGTRRVRVRIRSSVSQFDVDHFRGECVWIAHGEKPSRAAGAWPPPLTLDPKDGMYGSIFFQGPMFQNVVAYHDISSKHCLAKVRVPAGAERHAGLESPTILDSPVVRDAFLHAVQACVPEYRILPIAIESIDAYGFHGGHVFLSARERQRNDKEFIYDLDVYDPTGKCVERIRGYCCRILDDYRDEAALARVRSLHAMAVQAQRGAAPATPPIATPGGIDATV